MEKEQKKPRDREANWESAEKEFLRKCVNMHLDVVENKGNDNTMVLKKKNAWEAIWAAMVKAGFDREIPKLKSQWVRMKVNARKAAAKAKRTTVITGDPVSTPELSLEENIFQTMIKHEFEEGETLIDGKPFASPNAADYDEQDFFISADKPPNAPQQCTTEEIQKNKESSPAITIQKCFANNIPNNKEDSSPSKLQRLKNLPKTLSKSNIILERQRQIAKESLHSEEINRLQKKQLIAEIEHLERMHKIQEIQQNELHALKLQHLQRQIAREEELHNLKVEILRKMSENNQMANLNI